MGSHVDVAPKELRFRADTKRQPPFILFLTNNTDGRAAFKVKTTAPKRYCVKPSADVIAAHSTVEVKVFMQNTKDLTEGAIRDCKDKFLIQATPVPNSWNVKMDGENKNSELFNRRENPNLQEEKLKVLLEAPPAPPSPVIEGSERMEAGSPSKGASGALPTGASQQQTFTETVTASVSGLPDLRSENRRLREKVAALELTNQEREAALKVGSSAASSSAGSDQITLIHLVLVAIVAYILGVYLS